MHKTYQPLERISEASSNVKGLDVHVVLQQPLSHNTTIAMNPIPAPDHGTDVLALRTMIIGTSSLARTVSKSTSR